MEDGTFTSIVDLEQGGPLKVAQESPAARRGFAAKVLGQVCVLLALAAAICGAGMASSSKTQAYLQGKGLWIFYASIIVSFAILLSFFCSPVLLHHTPHKYISLVVFGAAIGVQCMYATLQYTVNSVLLVAGLTASTTLVLALYARYTTRDFTACGAGLSAALWLLIAFGLLQIWFHDRALQILVGCGGALLFSMYIIMDVQLILGGEHRQAYTIDDDVLATIGLFLDIVNLFLYLLELFGDRR